MPKLKKNKIAAKPVSGKSKSNRVTPKVLQKKKLSARLSAVRPVAAPAKAKLVKKIEKKSDKTIKSNGSARLKSVRISVPAAAHKPLTEKMLQIKNRLMQMLMDFRKDIAHEVRGAGDRDLAHINDTSDMASDAAEGDLNLRIAESETVEAAEIERALEKIDNGTYGICEMCNKPINTDRLEYLPYVTMCIKCQELSEIRKRDDSNELDDLAEGVDDPDNN
jgi:DnaK suppressor protein